MHQEDYGDKINNAVFPGEQGGPHLNSIAAKALLFRLANTDGFKEMQKQVVKNAKALADSFVKAGCKLAFGGTDSHMVLLDIRKIMGPDGFNLRGEIASRVLDMCGITCNKNTIPGDTSAVHPGALRFGTTWLTQRGFKEEDIYELGDIIITLLKSMVPYKYLEISGDVGRAKTPLSAIESAYERVQKLINKVENKTDKKEEKREIPARYPNFNRESPKFVTDASNKNICKYTLDGTLVRFIQSPKGFIVPSYCFGIAYIDGLIYCSNPGRHQVESYTTEGAFIASFGKAGVEAGAFSGCCNPAVLTSSTHGELLTSEKGIPRISCYGLDGQFRSILLDSKALGGGNAAYDVRVMNDKLIVAGGDKVSVFQYDKRQSQQTLCGQCNEDCPLKM